MQHKPVLFDQGQLTKFCKEHKLQPFRQKQILHEIFKNQNIDLESMTTLSKDLRKDISTHFDVLSLKVDKVLEDKETTKFSFKTRDGHVIESVLMYHRSKHTKKKLNRITICVSSQIGCPVGCSFCVTGKMGITRNLEWHEIISQLLFANQYIREKFGKKEDGTLNRLRNVVFMGMGEPLLNYDNMKRSLEVMLDRQGFSLSRRHITVSTSGILAGIQKMIDDKLEVKLAISLHAPTQELREKLIPIAKTNKLYDLMKILNAYVKATNNRIFYEYIMIKTLTDTPEIAHQLADLVQGQLCHVNLIPYNQNPAIDYEESEVKKIKQFKDILEKNGVTVTIRDSMGREVKSACGQLGYEKIKNKEE